MGIIIIIIIIFNSTTLWRVSRNPCIQCLATKHYTLFEYELEFYGYVIIYVYCIYIYKR